MAFRVGSFLLVGTLSIVGCLAASLASLHNVFHPGLGAISLFVSQLPNVQSIDHKSPISQRHCEDPVSWKGPQTVLGGVY